MVTTCVDDVNQEAIRRENSTVALRCRVVRWKTVFAIFCPSGDYRKQTERKEWRQSSSRLCVDMFYIVDHELANIVS